MPTGAKHREQTLSVYGVDGASVHKWMDEPWRIYGPSHRKVRHDKSQKLPQALIEEYGEELARNIMIDHVLLDRKKNDKQDKKNIEQLNETILVLREKIGQLETTRKDEKQKDNNEIYSLKRRIEKGIKNSREWKEKFIEKYCDVHSKMIECAIKRTYIRKGRLVFRYNPLFYNETITELEKYYRRLYLLDEKYDARWDTKTIIEKLGHEIMTEVFETIRENAIFEHSVFKREMLDTSTPWDPLS